MRQLHIRAAAALFALSLGQHAATATPISGLPNDGHLGNLSQYVNFQSDWVLNTDDGNLYANSGFGLQLNHQFATTTVSVSGQTARLFDFGNFDLVAGLQLRIVGGLPAVVAATGDFSVNGALSVTAGGGTGGLGAGSFDNGHSGNTAGGGGGQGGGAGFRVSGGGGGGGGNISAGQSGFSGTQHDYPPWVTQPSSGGTGGTGGAANVNPAGTFLGGGGGGGGGFVSGDFGFQEPGSSGGAGGGAVLFLTTGNFSVGSAGTVSANGASVPYNASQGGGGGGGAGGTIWFDVGGVVNINSGGLVSARGGAGGITDIQGLSYFPPLTNSMGGAGSGGFVYIDPTEIINDGIIDVSDGANGSVNGGLVTLVAPLIGGTGRIVGQAEPDAAVPEPVSLALVCIGLAGLGATRRRQAAPRQQPAVT